MPRGEFLTLEKIGDRIVADTIQMFCQMGTGVGGDRANQKFDILKFGNHSRILTRG